jgi:two-component system NtrC family sensor kinase
LTDPQARRRRYSLTSKVLLYSICSYMILTACIIAVWNLGAPRLGVPGHIPELIGLEKDHIRSSLEDKGRHLEIWLSARGIEAQGFANIDSPDKLIGILAAARSPDPVLDAARRDMEARYRSLCEGSTTTSRILVIRREDGRVLVDSSGRAAGSVFLFNETPGEADSGQYLDLDEVYSFSAARSASGIPVFFVLVAPIDTLPDEFHRDLLDSAKGLGFAFADSGGKLFSPLSIPDSRLRFAVGETPVEKALLERIAAGGEPVVLSIRGEAMSAGAAIVRISANHEMYIIAAVARNKTIGRIVRDSVAMAILVLLMVLAASFLTLRYIGIILSPLVRLHAAVEAFGRSEPYVLPEHAQGEIGEITRAFSSLTQRVGAWKSDLEAEVEMRTRMLKLTAELCGIYARDASETATVAAVNILKSSFKADAAVLFYANAKREYRCCLAGSDFPIVLPEDRWRACVKPLSGDAEISRFGPWSPPGMNAPLPSWMSCRLYSAKSEGGHIFLGRADGGWGMDEETELVAVVKTIAPIVQVRRERQIEEQVRQEAEEKLAGKERRLRTFLEGSRDMIYTADSLDIMTGINAAGLALLGRSEKTEIIGKSFSDFAFNAEDRAILLRRVREFGYAADFEIALKRENGSSVFCLETAYAIRDPEGGIVELQGIIKDITERISNESALWKRNIELADANLKIQRTQALMIQQEKLASIGQLAAGIAHEINNPLGFLKSNHEMLEKYLRTIRKSWDEAKSSPEPDLEEVERRWDLTYLFAEVDKMLDESDEGFARIMHIVGNLKSFSRVEQGTDFRLYDVNAGIENTLIVANNEIKYVADVKKDLGDLPQIRARGGEINQVILNILVNAAQAIEAQKRGEKGRIEIRTRALADRVVVGISDDGPGIPESLRMRIFDPFFTTKEPGKGTGLGLSISYDIIVTKHGGCLGVDSIQGEGCTFTIELPIAGPPVTDANPAQAGT